MSGKTFAAFLAVLAVVGLLAFGVIAKGEKQLEVGDEVPAAELPVLDGVGAHVLGETASVEDLRGAWVLINVWASWCNPCEDEAPDLVAFQREHGGRQFTILGVDTQDGSDDAAEFVREFGLNYPSIRDGSGDYAEELGTTGVPESILVDPEGKVAYTRPGQIDEEILRAEVLPLIGGAAGAPAGASEAS